VVWITSVSEPQTDAFKRFQAREAERAAAEERRSRWIWGGLSASLFGIFASLAYHDASAAWAMLAADPHGIVEAARHAPREHWRGLALLAAGGFDLLAGAWLLAPFSRDQDPELPMALMSVATLGALEFNWLREAPNHLWIGAGIAAVGLALAIAPASPMRRPRKRSLSD
jgi:hypothetical protein